MLIGQTYTFGEDPVGAPQAKLMKTVIDGQLAGNLPWDLVLAGVGLTIAAMIAGLQGLAFAIGVYLPIAALAPIFVGGVFRRIVDGSDAGKDAGANAGILAASGMVAGDIRFPELPRTFISGKLSLEITMQIGRNKIPVAPDRDPS